MIDLKEHQEYIKLLQEKGSRNWKQWEKLMQTAELIQAALCLKQWLLERPSLQLTTIEREAGLKRGKLNTLKHGDTILTPEDITLILPVLTPLGFSCTPKKSSSIKKFLQERKELISFAGLEKEAKIKLFTIDNHIKKNFAMSNENKNKLLPILEKYGYRE